MSSFNSIPKRWLVIGGGPCGIGSVARLLDFGVEVTWVDQSFSIGRMGEYYRNVPSNTLNGDLINGFIIPRELCFKDVEQQVREKGKLVMSELELERCYDLGLFVSTLEEMNTMLTSKVECVKGTVTLINKENVSGDWCVNVSTDEGVKALLVDVVLVCCGSAPTQLSSLQLPKHELSKPFAKLDGFILHNLDFMVDPVHVRNYLQSSHYRASTAEATEGTTALAGSQDTWVVLGNSHSAMLVIMNLYESGVRNIINFHRSELKFMHVTEEGWKRYQGVGLKGPVGAWASTVYQTEPSIRKIKITGQEDMRGLLQQYGAQHCVAAVGYQRDLRGIRICMAGSELSMSDLDQYDRMTGEIPLSSKACSTSGQEPEHRERGCSMLFGGGIAFPQDLIDGEGHREPWVGFKRSVEQVELMVACASGEKDVPVR